MGTRHAANWLPQPTTIGNAVTLIGYSDSDWAGDLHTRRSQPSFSRRQAMVATSSGVAEYYAATA
eukprot:3926180-Prorocentrum_lima.AAC.1